jgi:transcriptional regulator with XRE-family HTH domain
MLDLPSEREVILAIAARIRAARIARGISQSTFGAALGVTFQQIQKYEKAETPIAAWRLVLMARVLDVPVLELLGEAATSSERDTLILRKPVVLRLARLAETLPDLQLLRLCRLVEGRG